MFEKNPNLPDEPRNAPRKRLLLLAAALISAVTIAGCSGNEPGPRSENVAQEPAQVDSEVSEEEPVAQVASQLEASVVQVNVEAIQSTPFGEESAEGLGSGVVYRRDGYIITNNHVVQGASEVNVAFADGTTERGEVVGTDPRSDLAVVRVDRDDLPAASFSDEVPDVGQLAVAIGSPSGFESTVTAGIVSGLNREIPPEYTGGVQETALVDLLQTDAAISPGNSGGALANRDGQIIGINVAYLPQTQTGAPVEGLGFAIPSTTAIDIADQLIETGEVSTPYMGIVPVDITAQTAEQLNLDGVEEGGAGVGEVESGSPAADAELQREDVIIALNGDPIEGSGDLYGALRNFSPGDTVDITYVRNGREEDTEVTLGELPAQ